jgi:hypothetical protein
VLTVMSGLGILFD